MGEDRLRFTGNHAKTRARCPHHRLAGALAQQSPCISLYVLVFGDAGARQIEGARVAVAQNGGGVLGVEEAVVAVTILGR